MARNIEKKTVLLIVQCLMNFWLFFMMSSF